MRILFIGGTKRGYITLEALVSRDENVVGIISLKQFDDEAENYESAIAEIAKANEIRLFETSNFAEKNYEHILSDELKPDIAFVVGCRVLIPPEIYQIPCLGTLGVHDSLLPEYRGFAPLNWAIINGASHTGVTLFYLSELMDGGDIVAAKSITIASDNSAAELADRLCDKTKELVLETLPLFKANSVPRIKQNYQDGSFSCSRSPEDGLIDWAESSQRVYNKVRGLSYPYPGAFTFYQGKKIVIHQAQLHPNPPNYTGRIPGKVVNISKSCGWVEVLTGDGVIRLCSLRLEGDAVPAANVIRSVRESLGIQLVDVMRRIQDLENKLRSCSQGSR